jgi:glycosyltransferase involved in cell wall biosynthesis
MKILYLSADHSLLNDKSLAQVKILEYASMMNMLFIAVTTDFNKKSIKAKEIDQNIWIYQTNSLYKILYIWDIVKLMSFEIKDRNIFQADIIMHDGCFTNAIAGYILSKKFRRPVYVLLSLANQRDFLAPVGLKKFLLSKIMWFFFFKADCIQVDNFVTKERLRKKIAFKNHTIQVIKPFLDAKLLLASSRALANKERTENNFIQRKFPEFKFTGVVYLDSVDQVKLSIDILKKINEHFPPISLVMIISPNLKISQVDRMIKKLENFVRVVSLDEDLCEYLTSSNIFFGISEGEEYEEVISKACAVGATIVALSDDVSKKLIEDGTTGFICPIYGRQEIINYFTTKTLFLIKNPNVSVGFKMNIPITFKQQFNDTKKEYLNKLKLSWKECLAKYQKSNLKFYRY